MNFQNFKKNFFLFDIRKLEYYRRRARSAGTGYIENLEQMPIMIKNLINWNFFADTNALRPRIFNAFYQRRIQPKVRQKFIITMSNLKK